MLRSPGLENKVALVTGGCHGIGREISYELALSGATVLAMDLEPDDSFKDQLKEISQGNDVLYGNVRNSQQLRSIRQKIIKKGGSLDILVNNAGIVKVGPFEEILESEMKDLFRTNVYGVMNCCKIFGELMIKRGFGRIINLASTDASVGTTGHHSELGVDYIVSYAATKGAVLSFTKALAVEWGKYNINVNAVSPILVETPMTKHLFEDAEKQAQYKRGLPLQRNPQMQDISHAVLYLSSDLSKSVTGHILNVDCGYLAKSMRD